MTGHQRALEEQAAAAARLLADIQQQLERARATAASDLRASQDSLVRAVQERDVAQQRVMQLTVRLAALEKQLADMAAATAAAAASVVQPAAAAGAASGALPLPPVNTAPELLDNASVRCFHLFSIRCADLIVCVGVAATNETCSATV